MRLPMGVVIAVLAASAGCDRGGIADLERGVGRPETLPSSEAFGSYHALVIGINDYEHWPRLGFAEDDARSIRELLVEDYGFSSNDVTELIGNAATRSRILGALRAKLEALGENDNLLVYYAGHGQLDPLTDSGYWIPAEGDLYDDASWIPFTTITAYLSADNVEAKNVVVITDSCYGGALARSGPTAGNPRPGGDPERYISQLAELATKRSRQVIASGGYEQVPDESLFARLLRQALTENDLAVVDLELLFFSRIYPELRFVGQQEPVMTRVVSGPESDGQFVLVRDDAEFGPGDDAVAELSVRADQSDAEVLVDGELWGSAPATREVPVGRHVVRVEAPGFLPFEEELTVAADEASSVDVRLDAEPVDVEPPRVPAFEITPSEVRHGEPYEISWRTENAQRVAINGLGDVPLSGSRVITADESVDYELTAFGTHGERSSMRVSVEVKPALPTIDYFVAKPEGIRAGQAATLAWRVRDADVVYIDGFGSVDADGGLQDFRPEATTTYTLVATNSLKEEARASLTVTVAREPPPAIASFEIEPATIAPGERAVLRWRATGASATISRLGAVELSGTERVAPEQSTRYTLSVRNSAGTVTQETRALRVQPTDADPDPPALSISDAIRAIDRTRLLGATSVLHRQGRIVIPQTYLADFDSGEVGSTADSDAWFNAVTATERYFVPRNGATISPLLRSEPGIEVCRGVDLAARRIPIDQLTPGRYLCMRTNAGRLSRIGVTRAAGPSPGRLELDYVTWN